MTTRALISSPEGGHVDHTKTKESLRVRAIRASFNSAGVDYVIPWDDGGQTVTGALDILKPLVFTKGGDRDAAANVPEFDLCEKIGARVIFNVGGGKIQSSSTLVSAVKSFDR